MAEHRHVGSNNFNLFSSRSHTIFTLVSIFGITESKFCIVATFVHDVLFPKEIYRHHSLGLLDFYWLNWTQKFCLNV